MSKSEELKGEMARINQVFGEPPNETVIARLEDGTVVKGKASPDDLPYGMTFLFRGYFTNHPKYGRQFAFFSFGIAQPVGQRGTVAYLSRAPHIKRGRALQLWSLYGQDAVKMVREQPEAVAAAVSGLTIERVREAAEYFKGHIDREIVTRDLEELLSGGGFPKKLIDKLIEKFGARAAQVVKANCYILMSFHSVGFGKADKLYLAQGGNPTNPERLGWCAQHALASDREGSTWHQPKLAEVAIAKSVSGVTVVPSNGVEWAIERGIVTKRVDESGQVWIAEAGRAAAEARLTNGVWKAIVEGQGQGA